MVILDACFAGGGRSLPARGRPLVTALKTQLPARTALLAASSAEQASNEKVGSRHGLFTYYFLKGLNGAARGSKEGVTAQDLYDYLRPQVEDAARRDNRDQSPQLFVPPEGQRQLLIKDLR